MTGICSAQAWTAQVTVGGVNYDVYISGEGYAAVADSALVALNNDQNLSGVVDITSSVTYVYQWVDEDSNGDPILVTRHLTATVSGIKNGYTTNNYVFGAFYSCSKITHVNLPNTITFIGDYAFKDCRGLTSVTIPNSVITIGASAFGGCSGLTSVTIPNSVITIGASAFGGCSGLTSVTIPSSVITIGASAFGECSGLTSVTIPNSVISIGKYAFSNCTGLTSVDISNTITSISDGTFSNCTGLTSVTIPNSVTSIGNNAFNNCKGLSSITIPNLVTSIGEKAFSGCLGLTRVKIPNSVVLIDHMAFSNCTGLTRVDITDLDSWCRIIFGYKYNEVHGTYTSNPLTYAHHLYLNGQEVTDLTIPNSTTTINDYAFYGCTGLTSLTISNLVTSIGDRAFYGCSGLTSVVTGESVTHIKDKAFSGCSGLTSVTIGKAVKRIESAAFSGCSPVELVWNAQRCENMGAMNKNNIQKVTIGNEVIILPEGFVSFSKITDIIIPNSVTSIGRGALGYCYGLSSIDIPNSVTSIGSYAFENTAWFDNQPDGLVYAGLVAYKYKGNMPDDTQISLREGTIGIAADAFYDCTGLTNVNIPNSVNFIGPSAFYNTAWFNNQPDGLVYAGLVAYKYKGNMPDGTQISLRDGTISITEDAFSYCTGLTNVYIPNSVTSIGENAFNGCKGLTSIVIPNSVITIGNHAFSLLYNLKSIIIGNSVSYIGTAAFYANENLTDITCLAITPPTTSLNDIFLNYNASLHVPRISINAYKNMWPWSEFTNIDGFDSPDASGDVDGDGKVNIDDVTSLINGMLGGDALPNGADMDGDGRVNINDVTALINYLLYGHL